MFQHILNVMMKDVFGLFYVAVFGQHLLSFTHWTMEDEITKKRPVEAWDSGARWKLQQRRRRKAAKAPVGKCFAFEVFTCLNNLSQIHIRNGVIACSKMTSFWLRWRSNPLFSGSVEWPPSLNSGSGSAQGSCFSKSQSFRCVLSARSQSEHLLWNNSWCGATPFWFEFALG